MTSAPLSFISTQTFFLRPSTKKRKAELTVHCQRLGVEVVDGDWDHNTWLEAVKGLENEPERGRRCSVCFSVRLRATAKLAHDRGIARFTTTLASSRWKNLDQVNAAGQEAAEHYADVQYWDKNWRKDGLQDRRNALLKFYGFYNQTWCGCEFSYRDAQNACVRNSDTPRSSIEQTFDLTYRRAKASICREVFSPVLTLAALFCIVTSSPPNIQTLPMASHAQRRGVAKAAGCRAAPRENTRACRTP